MPVVTWLLGVFALAALASALLLGVPPAFALPAALAYLAGFLIKHRAALLLLLIAPLLLTLGAPVTTITSLPEAAWFFVALAAAVPFFGVLGGRLPLRATPVFIVLVLAPLVVFVLYPAFASVLAADIAPRLQVLLLATTALLAVVAATTIATIRGPAKSVLHVTFDEPAPREPLEEAEDDRHPHG